jgi:hypothetical protein
MPRQPNTRIISGSHVQEERDFWREEALPSEIQIPSGYDIGNVRAICYSIETGLTIADLVPFLVNLSATFQELELVVEIYRKHEGAILIDRFIDIKQAFSTYSERLNSAPRKKPCYICSKNFIYWNLISQKVLLDDSINLKSIEMCTECFRKKAKYELSCNKHLGYIYIGNMKAFCPLYPNKCKISNSCPNNQCLNEHAERTHKGYHTRRWKASKRFYSKTEGKVIKSDLLTGVEFEVIGKNKECLRKNLYKLGRKVGLDHDHSIQQFYLNTEVVTPPASGRKLENLIVLTSDALAKDGFIVNDRCGLHIHIDLFNKFGHININPDFYKSLLAEYILWEPIFYRLVPVARGSNANIKTIEDKYVQYFNSPGYVAQRKFSKIWYQTDDERSVTQRRNAKRDKTKYYWANFHSLLRKEGLEIRLMEGSVNANEILMWTKFNHDFINRVSKEQNSYLHFSERHIITRNASRERAFEMFLEWLGCDAEMAAFLKKRRAMHQGSSNSGVLNMNDRSFIDIMESVERANSVPWLSP